MNTLVASIDHIKFNPNNPRKTINEDNLAELSASIKEHGIIQPLVVVPDGDNFMLIAGERRLRAAALAGLNEVPIVIGEYAGEDQQAKIMLIENLQRVDLDPMEEAQAYKTLVEKYGYTQEALAKELGISQAQVANRIRLLELPDKVQENISRGIISASHGKVLASHKNLPAPLVEKVVEIVVGNSIPVAKTDAMVLKMVADNGKPLFEQYGLKPLFKSGKGSACYECKHRAMGKQWHTDQEQPYCLNPECWETKQEEVRLKKLEKALKEQQAAGGHDLVDIRKLNWDQYSHWAKGATDYDQSECKDCEHLKQELGGHMLYCLDPACMKKKKVAKTKADNKVKKDAFQIELQDIAEMAKSKVDTLFFNSPDGVLVVDRPVLVYLAAQVLGNISEWHERKVTLFKYLKEKHDWDHDILKRSAWGLLNNDWDVFHRLLETLDERQLLEVIFEWPAVARGLKGAEGWFLRLVQKVEPKPEPTPVEETKKEPESQEEQSPNPVHALIGRRIKTHYNTGGLVVGVAGKSDGFYSITYKHPRDGKACYINGITLKDGEILCEGIPLTILETDQENEETPGRNYIDGQGRTLFVSCGGDNWFTCYRMPGKNGSHRLKSQLLPLRKTREEAQFDLDMWAKNKGLHPVEDGNV